MFLYLKGLGPGHDSAHGVWLGGTDNAEGELLQGVTIPADANPVELSLWWLVESESEQFGDELRVIIQYGDEQADEADGGPGCVHHGITSSWGRGSLVGCLL